jgi:ubiquinone/menaquinone biosynthesis C-methylase UbiE
MTVKRLMFGTGREIIPDIAFYGMSLFFKVYYFLIPQDKYLGSFGIKPGDVVIDYGCGPGDYIKYASEAVGEQGKVYAVDIHRTALKLVGRIIKRRQINNVVPVLAEGYSSKIEDNAADLIYALDMFHMIEDTGAFLDELHRIIKKDGILVLEDGHQKRELARGKVVNSDRWIISGETDRHMKCKPLK